MTTKELDTVDAHVYRIIWLLNEEHMKLENVARIMHNHINGCPVMVN